MATINQTVNFNHPPEMVFSALTDATQHANFTGETASIEAKIGGQFSVYGDYATGQFTALEPNRSYEQTWHASDWEDDQISTVSVILSPNAEGCTLTLTQENVPDSEEDEISKGWTEWYWEPLAAYLDQQAVA